MGIQDLDHNDPLRVAQRKRWLVAGWMFFPALVLSLVIGPNPLSLIAVGTAVLIIAYDWHKETFSRR
jgi:hypothetical protein